MATTGRTSIFDAIRGSWMLQGEVKFKVESYEEYDKVDAIRSSDLKNYIDNPYLYLNKEEFENKEDAPVAPFIGSTVHKMLEDFLLKIKEEKDPSLSDFIEEQIKTASDNFLELRRKFKKKAKVGLNEEQKEQIRRSVTSLVTSNVYFPLIKKAHELNNVEKSVYFTVIKKGLDGNPWQGAKPIDCKVRLDFFLEDGDNTEVFNLKTIHDLYSDLEDEVDNSRVSRHCADFGYPRQGAMSILPFILSKKGECNYNMILLSKKPPYDIPEVVANEDFLSAGFYGGTKTHNKGLFELLDEISAKKELEKKKKGAGFPRKYHEKRVYIGYPTYY